MNLFSIDVKKAREREIVKGVVLDSSVVLALLNQELGHDDAKLLLPNAIMSAVNVAEIAGILLYRHKMPLIDTSNLISQLIGNIINFNEQQAYIAAQLYTKTKSLGLSLGDRACLALSLHTGYPVITADRIWQKLDGIDVNIINIR